MVVLEGHFRLTVYALAPESLPSEVTVLLETSPDIVQWVDYGTL